MHFNIHQAKTNLSRLIERALSGEEVVIAKAGSPVVKLVPVPKNGGKKRLGSAKGIGKLKKGWEAPLTDKEMSKWFGL
jgi:prevent-host-death family protein